MKCKNINCRKEILNPRNSLQQVCNMNCAIEFANQQREKKAVKQAKQERREYREAKVKLKTRGEWAAEAQDAVNAFIRERDKNKKCISDPQAKHKSTKEAGHYLAISTHPELRFNEDNIHGQCYHCNHYNKNAHHAYRKELIKRIGLERVESLEAPHPPAKRSIEDLKAITKTYQLKLKELKCQTA